MKIGLLTQPLYNNYGGILQAYALQRVLSEMGHDVWLLQRDSPKVYDKGFLSESFYRLKAGIKQLAGISVPYKSNRKEEQTLGRETRLFIEKHIPQRSPRFLTTQQLEAYVKDNCFDGIVVGSDQVWRPAYSPAALDFFLDFCKDLNPFKRIAYAASLGTDSWDFTEEMTHKCRELVTLFDAISVRELSAIHLCREKLGIDALLVQDPTLFLSKQDYRELVLQENEQKNAGNLFCYVLDKDSQKQGVINHISSNLNLKPFTVWPQLEPTRKNIKKDLNGCVFPRVTQWLQAYQDAKMVITDSFHGCVFSIIFEVPFWVMANPSRGNARFESLLSVFHLENRLLNPNDFVLGFDASAPIDWEGIKCIRESLREVSSAFLSSCLNQ